MALPRKIKPPPTPPMKQSHSLTLSYLRLVLSVTCLRKRISDVLQSQELDGPRRFQKHRFKHASVTLGGLFNSDCMGHVGRLVICSLDSCQPQLLFFQRLAAARPAPITCMPGRAVALECRQRAVKASSVSLLETGRMEEPCLRLPVDESGCETTGPEEQSGCTPRPARSFW